MDISAALTALSPDALALAFAVMFLGGLVKGAVGFAMPMVAAGGLGVLLSGQQIVALLIMPTLISNIWQVMRQGWSAARDTMLRFWKLNLAMLATMPLSAQLLPHVSSERVILFLGVIVCSAAAIQLSGIRPALPAGRAGVAWEVGVGVLAGLVGGIAAIWGPPVLLFYIALGLAKTERIRAQGLNFAAGALILVPAHLSSGVLDGAMLPLSVLLTVPVMAGMAVGLRWQDRMNQELFRRVTLVVLCLAGLNLLRRGLAG